jgi:hypothetical protein
VSEFDPSASEIQQSEIPDYQAVKVQVEGPVRVQEMPAVMVATNKYSPDNTAAVKILQANPRRFRAVITVRTQVVYLGASQGEASSTKGAFIPAPFSIVLRNNQEMWAIGGSASASEIGVIEEYWAN